MYSDAGRSVGNCPISSSRACRPPAEVPITIMLRPLVGMRVLSKGDRPNLLGCQASHVGAGTCYTPRRRRHFRRSECQIWYLFPRCFHEIFLPDELRNGDNETEDGREKKHQESGCGCEA